MIGARSTTRGVVLSGRYELVREIASGGMAEVWLGHAKSIGDFERRVAIKCCHPHLRKDAEFVAMFLDEARLAAKIHHPNVVATLDVVDDPQALFLVMEYVEGATLQALVRAEHEHHRCVPADVALRVVIDALEGLQAAHALKIVHRDVSPHNILVGADGISRITDFGVAKAEARATVTRDGQVKGKLGYMAPEQLTSRELGARADVFSMGVVLWEALVGARLFRGDTDVDTATMILNRVIDPPSQRVPELPKSIDDVVMRALERDPDRRFASAAEMADAIQTCGAPIASVRRVGAYVKEMRGPAPAATAEGATHATKPTVAEIEEGSKSVVVARSSRRGVAIGIAVLALAAVVAFFAWPRRGRETTTDAPKPSASPTPTPNPSPISEAPTPSPMPTPAIEAPSSSAQTAPSTKKGPHAPLSPPSKTKPTATATTAPAAPTPSEYHPPLL